MPLRTLVLVGAVAGILVGSGVVYADVILAYTATSSPAGAASPFEFVNGANYATANGQGFETNTYPNAADVSVAVTFDGAEGALSTYELDTLAVETEAATTAAWTLQISVSTALVATGVNAAWVSYCSVAPTGVADTGAPLASGTDANHNPWAIYPPTCTGTQVNEPLTALGTGGTITVASGTAAHTSVLFISFLVAVTNTGATTTTPASLTVLATT